jgi:ceramide glucosyltransferase
MIAALRLAPSFAEPATNCRRSGPAVTILKPVHGDEAGLFENLASFCSQDYAGEVQIVFGVTSPNDPAIGTIARLRAAFPDKVMDLVVNSRMVGSNPKVANLVNMEAHVRHEIVVIADSDIRVTPDYLSRVVGALERSEGAVTCAYYGIAAGGLPAQLSQLFVDGQFLPGVMVGVRFGLARPCFGSTIALSRGALAAVGGFERFADCLADDFALGQALRKNGMPVSVLPFAVGHVCSETSLAELWRHELRWASTIRSIDPLSYLGWSLTHAFPLALLALCIGGGAPALALAMAAIACRIAVLHAVARGYGLPPHPYWLVPLRDLLSFAVFLAGFVARDVSWKGRRYRLIAAGALAPERGSTP